MLQQAFALHSKGQFAEAERAYTDLLRLQPRNFQALHLYGVLMLQRGQTERGIELLRQSLRLEPRQPLAQRDLGNALQQSGQAAEALACYDKALALKSDQADVYNNRGVVLAALKRRDEALASYGRAVALKPDYAQAYNNRGTVLTDQKRYAEALEDFSRAITLIPGYVKAFNNRAGVLADLGRLEEALKDHDRAIALAPGEADSHGMRGNLLMRMRRPQEALESFDRALALDPALASAHNDRGTALAMLKRPQEALESHERAIALEPNMASAHNNRGTALAALKRPAEALPCHEKALALDPDSATAHSNRGGALADLGRYDEALASVDHALTLMPFAQAYSNRGNFLYELKRFDEALESYDRAIALNPEWDQAHFGKSLALLVQGRFAEAWPEYEWRKRQEYEEALHALGRPTWSGKEDLKGKTIFVEAEQGLGDTIHFCRYVPMVANLGANVILTAQESLIGLLQSLDPRITILPSGTIPPEFDYHIALLSLPLAFGTEVATIPAKTPYLSADPARTAALRDRIGETGFKIGICWQGSYISAVRSLPLLSFEPLARLPGVRLISLQKGEGTEQLETLPPGMTVEQLGDGFPKDFDDTAAAMMGLDLIISCDTSVAHLAGALGRPTWVALRYATDWRWLLDRRESPWYPGMRLFRQPRQGDWAGAFAGIQSELAALLAGKN
jgi:tetratricopeptide (TPR) repeat protein